ncbi:hypothetical protein Dimus_011572 [Dionaea muscipula]
MKFDSSIALHCIAHFKFVLVIVQLPWLPVPSHSNVSAECKCMLALYIKLFLLLKESWMLLLLISLLMSHHHANGDFVLIRSICAKTRYCGECTKCLRNGKPPTPETVKGICFLW